MEVQPSVHGSERPDRSVSDERGGRKSAVQVECSSKEEESQTGTTVSHDTAEEWRAWVASTEEDAPGAHAQKSLPWIFQGHQDHWDSKLWSDETKMSVFEDDGFKSVWRR